MKQIVKGDQVMCKRASSDYYNKAGVVMKINRRRFVSDRESADVRYADDATETTPTWQLSLVPDDVFYVEDDMDENINIGDDMKERGDQ